MKERKKEEGIKYDKENEKTCNNQIKSKLEREREKKIMKRERVKVEDSKGKGRR